MCETFVCPHCLKRNYILCLTTKAAINKEVGQIWKVLQISPSLRSTANCCPCTVLKFLLSRSRDVWNGMLLGWYMSLSLCRGRWNETCLHNMQFLKQNRFLRLDWSCCSLRGANWLMGKLHLKVKYTLPLISKNCDTQGLTFITCWGVIEAQIKSWYSFFFF